MISRDTSPFSPTVAAAARDAREQAAAIDRARVARPGEWVALRLASYTGGEVTIALIHPEAITVHEYFYVCLAGLPIPVTRGPGTFAALLPSDVSQVEVLNGDTRIMVDLLDASHYSEDESR